MRAGLIQVQWAGEGQTFLSATSSVKSFIHVSVIFNTKTSEVI